MPGLALGGADPVKAGFLQPPDTTLLISSTTASRFSHNFNARGRLERARQFSKLSVETYVEQGLTPQAMILWRLSSDIEQPQYLNDPGQVRRYAASLGMRHALTSAYGWAISAQAMGGITSDLSRHGFGGEAKLVAARNISIADTPGFVDLKFGYRHGAAGERSEWQLDATLGVHLHANLLWLGQSFIAHAGQNGTSPAFWRIKIDTSLVYRINERWSLQAGAFTVPLGRNAGQESGVRIAVWRRF